jgi:hypothetical protein
VPSQKLLDELNASLRQSQKVLQQLFPNADLNQLGELPRGELIELINTAGAPTPSSGRSTSPQVSSDNQLARSQSEDASSNLEVLEQEPAPYANWNEAKVGPGGIPPIPDDVNALSMNVGKQSSYLGVSSIAAALRVISKINNALGSAILGSPPRTAHATRSNSPRRAPIADESAAISVPTLSEGQLIDAYFYHVHPLIPMIDETRFRVRFSAGERKDPSWVALLNMVFALGTIAGSTAEDNSHLLHYQRAKSCVDLEMFGNGSIEALQALGLMGGLYLHYESRPNMANAIMGAALRMACALGLHREYSDNLSESRPDFVRKTLLIPREVRRRTWWSLFCMDTWATTTQGRPSLGRISPAVTVLPPSYLGNPPDQNKPATISDDDAFVMTLSQEVAFCKIATRIQDRLAETPLLPPEEKSRFDLELQAWHKNLPPMFHPSKPCPERIKTPRAIMSWRFHNLRLVLHRPLLLNNALRSSLDQKNAPSEDELKSVAICRQIAVDTIEDIQAQWKPTQMSGWNAVWLLFQASMAPLVTLFAEYNRKNLEEMRTAQAQIEQVITLLHQMAEWSITARKTRNFMVKIYSHSKSLTNPSQDQVTAMSNLHMSDDVIPPPQPPRPTLGNVSGQYQPIFPGGSMISGPNGLSRIQNNMPRMHRVGLDQQLPLPQGIQGSPHTTFMSQDELNAFWNQVMWGEGDMPEIMMDTTYDYDLTSSYQNWN